MENSGILLLPVNLQRTCYHGFIKANDVDYYIEMKFQKPFTNASVKSEWKLRQKLKYCMADVKQKLEQSSGPEEFCAELQKLLRENTERGEATSASIDYCSTLVKHIEDLGWDKVQDVNKNFTEITMKAVDAAGREHTFIVHPDTNFPTGRPDITADLPTSFLPQWGGAFSSLKQLYQQFVEVLAAFQRFWDEGDELHERCWILEPEKPSFSAKEFRIALSANSSILLSIDPSHPENPPECRFMGAEITVLPVRERFLNGMQEWNETLSIYQNLRHILRISFPVKKQDQSHEAAIQCGICYSYKLENDIPEQACNERRCGQLFHRACLVEWIQSVPGAKQSFQTLYGECPYCNSAITVKL